jgi:hypothetical protein
VIDIHESAFVQSLADVVGHFVLCASKCHNRLLFGTGDRVDLGGKSGALSRDKHA